MPNNRSARGFTLIELLIVMTIIAILVVIGVTLYGSAQTTARDTTRKGDMDAIAQALEGHFNPVAGSCDVGGGTTVTAPAGTYCPAIDSWFSKNKIPFDPKNTGTYVYTGIPLTSGNPQTVSSWVICAGLENATGNATSSTGAGLGTTTTGQFYCRASQQK